MLTLTTDLDEQRAGLEPAKDEIRRHGFSLNFTACHLMHGHLQPTNPAMRRPHVHTKIQVPKNEGTGNERIPIKIGKRIKKHRTT